MRATYFTFMLCFLAVSIATAGIVRIDINHSGDVANGKAYGLAGPYEALAGKID